MWSLPSRTLIAREEIATRFENVIVSCWGALPFHSAISRITKPNTAVKSRSSVFVKAHSWWAARMCYQVWESLSKEYLPSKESLPFGDGSYDAREDSFCLKQLRKKLPSSSPMQHFCRQFSVLPSWRYLKEIWILVQPFTSKRQAWEGWNVHRWIICQPTHLPIL